MFFTKKHFFFNIDVIKDSMRAGTFVLFCSIETNAQKHNISENASQNIKKYLTTA